MAFRNSKDHCLGNLARKKARIELSFKRQVLTAIQWMLDHAHHQIK